MVTKVTATQKLPVGTSVRVQSRLGVVLEADNGWHKIELTHRISTKGGQRHWVELTPHQIVGILNHAILY